MPSKRQTSSSQSASSRASPSTSKSVNPSSGSQAPSTNNTNTPTTTSTTTTAATATKNSATGNSSSKPQSSSSSLKAPAAALKSSPSPQEILSTLWGNYYSSTPQRTKLIDAFMGFLVLVGALQFVYCVLVGNYPFNAFLSGFSATVGQFVLTASLRIQTNPANQSNFASISPERAFADFILGSLILQFFCINFIN